MRAYLVVLVIGLGGCCAEPWRAYPESTQPGEQYSTGDATHGEDVYVWDCLGGSRVVVSQYSAENSCQAPKRATAACGGTTETDTRLASENHGPIRSGRAWP